MKDVQNTNSVAFRSNYLIPYSEINKSDSETMRQVGAVTAKYATTPENMAQTSDGIAVKINDAKDKEYEAIIAKYGLNIQKYDSEIKPQSDITERSYRFMISKIDPENVETRINAYKNMDSETKGKEYLNVYKEFKNNPNSIEYQQNIQKPKVRPTNKPIVKYTTKTGENMMAREVVLGNGYKCIAVANAENPGQVTLMNKDEFKKLFLESVEQKEIAQDVAVKKASGQFADKDFEVECKNKFSNRSLSGKVDSLDFNINHNNKLFKSDLITGTIGDKNLNLELTNSFAKQNLKGKLGDKDVDLKITHTFGGYNIKGIFKDQKIDIDIDIKWRGFAIKSDKIDLNVKGKSLFGNDVKVQGKYEEDPDLIPILMDMVYSLNNDQAELLMLLMVL